MINAKVRIPLAILLLSTAVFFVASCGGSGDTSVSSDGVSSDETAPAPLPANSSVTLEKVSAPNNDNEGALYVADASTGDIFQVKTETNSWLSPMQWISPTKLVSIDYFREYYLLDLDAKTLTQLPSSPSDYGASFSHAGDMMAFPGPTGQLFLWSVKDDKQIAEIPATNAVYSTWSPDDTHVFWPGGPAGISTVGAQPAVISLDLGDDSRSAVWSSDGKSLVYVDEQGVQSVDARSGAKTTLYSWPGGVAVQPHSVKISPDGKFAVVPTPNGSGNFRALIVPLDGGAEGMQVTSVWGDDAEWSPNGNGLAIIADWCKPNARLVLLNPDGSIRSTIATDDVALQIPRFSPDGSVIAYVGSDPNGGGEGGLVLKSVEGDGAVAFLPGVHADDVWSPDGKWLAYSPGPLPYQCMDVAGATEILPFP